MAADEKPKPGTPSEQGSGKPPVKPEFPKPYEIVKGEYKVEGRGK